MNRFGLLIGVIVVVLVAVIASISLFTVDPTEQALVLRFGEPVRDLIDAPGLYARVPFIDTVVYIDKRILALDDERQEVLVADNQRLEVDAFVRYRIADPLLFYQSVLNVQGANAQLGGMLNSALRRTLSEASISDIVRNRRDELMAEIRDQVREGAKRFGIEVDRRAHQARRSAGGELRGGVPPHAGRAPAARRLLSRAGRAAERRKSAPRPTAR